jgi:hypothetical protein
MEKKKRIIERMRKRMEGKKAHKISCFIVTFIKKDAPYVA